MIKIGKLTYPFGNIVKEINKAKKLGFDYVEIGIEFPTNASILKKNKSSIIKALKNFQYPPLGHTCWWYLLNLPYDGVRKAWLSQAKIDINIANELGIKLLNFHFWVPTSILLENKESRKIILDNYVKSLNELTNFAKKKQVILMLENGEEKFGYYKYVLDRIPKLKVHFDIGHAFLSGGMTNIKRFISYFGDRIIHVHIHDNHGKLDEHLALGKGKINWKKVFSWLKKPKYDKTITFEVFKSEKDLIKSIKYFKKFWYN